MFVCLNEKKSYEVIIELLLWIFNTEYHIQNGLLPSNLVFIITNLFKVVSSRPHDLQCQQILHTAPPSSPTGLVPGGAFDLREIVSSSSLLLTTHHDRVLSDRLPVDREDRHCPLGQAPGVERPIALRSSGPLESGVPGSFLPTLDTEMRDKLRTGRGQGRLTRPSAGH